VKSTPGQTAKRRELKRLVALLGELAWQRYPDVAPCAVFTNENKDAPVEEGDITYDEFYVVQHDSKSLPALMTKGKVFLRFRRRITSDHKIEQLWHLWDPGYAGTKPESVDELLPVIKAHIALLQRESN
jgi:hypothetical protein